MKLILSSRGLQSQAVKNAVKEKQASLKIKKLCLICSGNIDDRVESEVKKVFKISKVNIFDLKKDLSGEIISSADAFYFYGGNTFFVLKRLRELDLFRSVSGKIKKGAFYLGSGAGSIIVGQNTAGVSKICGHKNKVGLETEGGFSLIPFDIVTGYKEEIKENVAEYHRRSGESVVALSDNQAVMVWGDDMEIIGPEEEGFLFD